ERGEGVLRGQKVLQRYRRDPGATAAGLAGGWSHTGDIVVRDEDGYRYTADSLQDTSLTGGDKIASSESAPVLDGQGSVTGAEVERVRYEHEAVVEAAVVGRPDERCGEVPVAFVVVDRGAAVVPDNLLAHCRERLAGFKAPKAVTFIDALPRNPSGKVLKREL